MLPPPARAMLRLHVKKGTTLEALTQRFSDKFRNKLMPGEITLDCDGLDFFYATATPRMVKEVFKADVKYFSPADQWVFESTPQIPAYLRGMVTGVEVDNGRRTDREFLEWQKRYSN